MKQKRKVHPNHTEKPYIHRFSAEQYDFVLDLYTNRIFSLEAREAQVLKRWQKGQALSELAGNCSALL